MSVASSAPAIEPRPSDAALPDRPRRPRAFTPPPLSEWSSESKLVAAVLALCLLALIYPLIALAGWMLGRGHYQHFPLLILAAGGLAAYRFRQDPPPWFPTVTPRVLLATGIAVLLTTLVFILPSRWLASVSGIACSLALVLLFGGQKWPSIWKGPLLLLVAALPLPVNFDMWFVVGLQQLATWLASVWLDYRGVLHMTTGVAILTTDHEYFVKDACSGINSVFAAIAVGIGYGVLRDYSVRRVLVLVAQMLVWVVVANAGRVFVTVFAQARWGIDTSGTTLHELLGLATFAGGVLLAISTDHLIRYLRPTALVEPGVDAEPSETPEPDWLDEVVGGQVVYSLVGGAVAFAVIFGGLLFQFEAQPVKPIPIEEMAEWMVLDLESLDESSMPSQLGQWRRSGFRTETRGPDSVFGGMLSVVWEYHNGNRSVGLSLDGPYDAWHDLAVCYGGVGWQVGDMRTFEAIPKSTDWPACELSLERQPVDTAQVLYLCVNPEGGVVPPPPYFGMPLSSVVRRLGIGMQDGPKSMPGVVQLQLMDQRAGKISAQDQKANRELFELAVRHLFE